MGGCEREDRGRRDRGMSRRTVTEKRCAGGNARSAEGSRGARAEHDEAVVLSLGRVPARDFGLRAGDADAAHSIW
jgi:hypothetical protein